MVTPAALPKRARRQTLRGAKQEERMFANRIESWNEKRAILGGGFPQPLCRQHARRTSATAAHLQLSHNGSKLERFVDAGVSSTLYCVQLEALNRGRDRQHLNQVAAVGRYVAAAARGPFKMRFATDSVLFARVQK